ncbi:hypothetical protein, partial [Methylothermus subterraneus]
MFVQSEGHAKVIGSLTSSEDAGAFFVENLRFDEFFDLAPLLQRPAPPHRLGQPPAIPPPPPT